MLEMLTMDPGRTFSLTIFSAKALFTLNVP